MFLLPNLLIVSCVALGIIVIFMTSMQQRPIVVRTSVRPNTHWHRHPQSPSFGRVEGRS